MGNDLDYPALEIVKPHDMLPADSGETSDARARHGEFTAPVPYPLAPDVAPSSRSSMIRCTVPVVMPTVWFVKNVHDERSG